jgi:hypothetical protein
MSYLNRTLSYTFTGTITGTMEAGRKPTDFSPDYAFAEFTIECGQFVRFQTFFVGPGLSKAGEYRLVLSWISSMSGPGASATYNPPASVPPDGTLPPTFTTLHGTYTVVIQLDETVDVTFGGAGNPALTDELTADVDLVFAALAHYGGTVTATCTYGGATVTDTMTVTDTHMVILPSQRVSLQILINDNHTGVMSAQSITCTPQWNGQGLAAPGGSAATSFVSAAWGPAISLVVAPGHTGSVLCGALPTTRYDLQGRVYAVDAPYPDAGLVVRVNTKIDPFGTPVTVDLPVTGGAFGINITQDSWGYGASADGTAIASGGLEERSGVLCTLLSSSLVASGEDTDLAYRHLWMRGWTWNAATIRQAGSINAISGSWTATGSAGTITVPSTAFDSRLLGASWSGASLAGYAFADVSLAADAAGQPARIHLGSKYWDVVVGTAGSVRIDLCTPASVHGSTDTTDSQYPFSGSGVWTAAEGWSSAVRNVSSVLIDGLSAGHVYTLTGITLIRTDHSRITFLDAFKDWILVSNPTTVGGVTTSTFYRPARMGDTDAQQSMEQTDFVRTIIAGTATSDVVSPIDIKTAVANINGAGGAYPSDGWSAADSQTNDGSTNVRNGLLNSDQPSSLLYGSGLSYDGSAWHSGVNLDASSSLVIPANFLFNSIQVYPAAGDPFFGGPAGSATPLRPAIIMRGRAWGLVNDTKKRKPRISVKATDSGVAAGSGTTSRTGEYETGLPYIKGTHSVTITANSGNTPPSVTETFATRQRRRVCFGVVPTCCATIFCSDHFFFPFAPQAGDHSRLPLEAWREIPDAAADEEETQTTTEMTPVTAGGR